MSRVWPLFCLRTAGKGFSILETLSAGGRWQVVIENKTKLYCNLQKVWFWSIKHTRLQLHQMRSAVPSLVAIFKPSPVQGRPAKETSICDMSKRRCISMEAGWVRALIPCVLLPSLICLRFHVISPNGRLGYKKHLQNNAFNGTWRKHGGAKHACCHISALVPLKASEGVCEALFCWLYMSVFYVR